MRLCAIIAHNLMIVYLHLCLSLWKYLECFLSLLVHFNYAVWILKRKNLT